MDALILFGHSGGLGDIIYSLRVIKDICINEKCNIYIKRYNHYNNFCDNYQAIKDLLEIQPYVSSVYPYTGELPVLEWGNDIFLNYNLDNFRISLNIFENHIIKCTYVGLGLEIPNHWNQPWIELNKIEKDYIIINRTFRYRKSNLFWNDLLKKK